MAFVINLLAEGPMKITPFPDLEQDGLLRHGMNRAVSKIHRQFIDREVIIQGAVQSVVPDRALGARVPELNEFEFYLVRGDLVDNRRCHFIGIRLKMGD